MTLLSNKIDSVAAHVSSAHYDPSTGANIPATSQAIVTTAKLGESRHEIVVKSENSRSLTHFEPLQPHHGISPLVASNKCETGRFTQREDGTKTAQTSRRVCDASCRCRCHSCHLWRLQYFRSILGSLSITWKGSSLLKGTCDDTRCLSNPKKTTCVYAFPFWLLDGIISISYSCELAKGPELLLRVMRTRDFADFYALIYSSEAWAVIEMKRMLDCGEASVFDIHEEGDSILHVAVINHRWDIAQLLIFSGADMHYTKPTSECLDTPFVRVFNHQWCGESQRGVNEKCQAILSQSSIEHDMFDFPDLHKACLKLIPQDFGEILTSLRRKDIDQVDNQGKTVLHWAALRGDSRAIARLLACGAEPNTKDMDGNTPLQHAVPSDIASVELLLMAKADVNNTNKWGRTPMHYISPFTTSSVQRMIDLGADIDCSDHNGSTPLHKACHDGNIRVVEKLLSCGADINAQTKEGNCSIHTAIMNDHNRTLSILTSNPHVDYKVKNHSDWSVVDLATVYGGIQTLQILKDAWPASLEFGSESDLSFLREEAEYRRDCNEQWSREYQRVPDRDPVAWFDAFVDMVETISERHMKTFDSDCEDLDSEDESNDDDDDDDDDEYSSNDEACLSKDGPYDSGDEASNSEEEAWEIAREHVVDSSPLPDTSTSLELPQPSSSNPRKGS